MPHTIASLSAWVLSHLQFVIPLLFCLWMTWTDVRTHRIPNLLSLLCALSGLGYQMGTRGLSGLGDGLLGLVLGFGLMIGFYRFGGLGAGDVKAIAALGTWLGPWNTLLLFIFMALSGLPLVIVFLWYRGQLFNKISQIWSWILNAVSSRSKAPANPDKTSPAPEERMPYAVAIALGMILFWLSRPF